VGRFREKPEDFEVEEILSYEPSGEGTHHFLWMEKRGLTTFECVKRLARALERKERDFGYAGLKDRNAVTRQWISIEHLDARKLEGLEISGLRLLKTSRHRNKIKLGHLKGNRFRLVLRGARDGDLQRARAVLDLCSKRGVPNFYGLQRFGRGRSTPALGRLLLEGKFDAFFASLESGHPILGKALGQWKRGTKAVQALRSVPRRFLSLCSASLQAQVFNDCLRARLATLDQIEEGDIAFLHKNGACFLVEDPVTARPRCASFEISATGPLPGPKCLLPQARPAALEASILARHSLRHDSFALTPNRYAPFAQQGARRPLRVPIGDSHVSSGPQPGQLLLSFTLPRGSYATAVLAELLRFPPDQGP
jgi:tRNA pseudouridine13 synthase